MSYPVKLTPEQAQAAFAAHGTIAAAARSLGVSDATVKRHLKDPALARTNVSDAEKAHIKAYYETTPVDDFDLDKLAQEMRRTRQQISRHAGLMGLTKPGRPHKPEVNKAQGAKMAAKIAENGHPRGMAGKKHKDEAKAKIAAKSAQAWEEMKATGTGNMSPANLQIVSDRMSKMQAANVFSSPYSRAKYGKRPDLGEHFFRSAWEANYARYLNLRVARGEIERWEYEPTTFWFEKIRRGVRSYKPDFRVYEKGQCYYVEVKGWFDAKSQTKMKRMRIYHPKVDVRLVGSKDYLLIQKEFSHLLPHWEHPPKPVRKPTKRASRAKLAA
jgi:hypothetical protein